jgi:nucleotide-binding universal stress UspA family protein
MRIPGKSEADAFRIAAAFGVLVGISVFVGWVASSPYGAVVFAAGVAAGLVFELAGPEADRRLALREAAHSPHRHGSSSGKRHILVVATRPLGGSALREELSGPHRDQIELDVLAPVLSSLAHYWASDYDHERAEAQARLEASLAWAAEQGLTARGELGDPDPLTGIEDELRDFGADEVIVATHRRDRASWLATRMVDHLSSELDIPVKQIAVNDDRDPRAAQPQVRRE